MLSRIRIASLSVVDGSKEDTTAARRRRGLVKACVLGQARHRASSATHRRQLSPDLSSHCSRARQGVQGRRRHARRGRRGGPHALGPRAMDAACVPAAGDRVSPAAAAGGHPGRCRGGRREACAAARRGVGASVVGAGPGSKGADALRHLCRGRRTRWPVRGNQDQAGAAALWPCDVGVPYQPAARPGLGFGGHWEAFGGAVGCTGTIELPLCLTYITSRSTAPSTQHHVPHLNTQHGTARPSKHVLGTALMLPPPCTRRRATLRAVALGPQWALLSSG